MNVVRQTMTSLLEQLRAATAALHSHLDRHTMMSELMSADLTEARYRQILQHMYPAHQQLESAVQQGAQELRLGYPLQARLAWLDDDLIKLQCDIPTMAAVKNMTNQAELTHSETMAPVAIGSLPALVGWLYVLEGSRLGAAVIAKRLQRQLPNSPCSFFSRSIAPQAWSQFLLFAQQVAAADSDEVIDAAQQAFTSYIEQLKAPLGAPLTSAKSAEYAN